MDGPRDWVFCRVVAAFGGGVCGAADARGSGGIDGVEHFHIFSIICTLQDILSQKLLNQNNMLKRNILYGLAVVFMIIAAYFIYQWFQAEPDNREPLPALLSLISTIIITIIAWQKSNGNVSVKGVTKSKVDVDSKGDVSVEGIEESEVLVNKGKNTLKSNS